jgi:hypothetical protein
MLSALSILILSQEHCPEVNFYDKYLDHLVDKTPCFNCNKHTVFLSVYGAFQYKVFYTEPEQ